MKEDLGRERLQRGGSSAHSRWFTHWSAIYLPKEMARQKVAVVRKTTAQALPACVQPPSQAARFSGPLQWLENMQRTQLQPPRPGGFRLLETQSHSLLHSPPSHGKANDQAGSHALALEHLYSATDGPRPTTDTSCLLSDLLLLCTVIVPRSKPTNH